MSFIKSQDYVQILQLCLEVFAFHNILSTDEIDEISLQKLTEMANDMKDRMNGDIEFVYLQVAGGETVFRFGKYVGKTFAFVAMKHPGYFKYLLNWPELNEDTRNNIISFLAELEAEGHDIVNSKRTKYNQS